jgi:hypothetical protein
MWPLRRRRPLEEAVTYAHVQPLAQGVELVLFPHSCSVWEMSVGAVCTQCELALEPADKQPSEPHGWIRCAGCNSLIIACPLGVAEGEGLGAANKVDLPETVGVGE